MITRSVSVETQPSQEEMLAFTLHSLSTVVVRTHALFKRMGLRSVQKVSHVPLLFGKFRVVVVTSPINAGTLG